MVFGIGVLLASQAGHFVGFGDTRPAQPPPQSPKTPLFSKSEFKKWVAQTDATVFDLHYRGMEREDLSQVRFLGPFNSLSLLTPEQADRLVQSGHDSPESVLNKTPFIRSVGLTPDKACQFQFFLLSRSPEGLVEYSGKTIKALYLDLDCDGKLGQGEKMEPVQTPNEQNDAWYFITPDFEMTAEKDERFSYRLSVRVVFEHGQPQIHLAPFCRWEGTTTVAGAETRVRLVHDGFILASLFFGHDKIQFLKESESSPENPARSEGVLSHLVRLDGAYYQLRLQEPGTGGKALHVALSKDPAPLGRIEIQQDQTGPARRFQNLQLTSLESPCAFLYLNDPITEVPQGRYSLWDGRLPLSGKDWVRVTFACPPWYDVVADQTVTVKCGNPKFKIEAFQEPRNMMSMSGGPLGDGEEKGTDEPPSFPCGTDVRLNLRLMGLQGEEYGHLYEFSENDSAPLPERKSHLQVLGPDGQMVASADLEYG